MTSRIVFSLCMLIFCASCIFRKEAPSDIATNPSHTPTPAATVLKSAKTEPIKSDAEREVEKILHWFEQMDAVYREALWVIRKERAPQGKSMFGKMQRALLVDLKQKLSNKSIFKCDVYSMKRDVLGLGGVPQSAEVYHRCNSRESFIQIGDWSHPKSNEMTMNFKGTNLAEVFGFATSILSPRVQCKLKSSENGIIETFSCDGLMLDYDAAKNQVLKFSAFEYTKASKNILHIKGEVLENLDPVRKIEVDVPMEGKITVTETVLQATEHLATQVPATPAPAAASKAGVMPGSATSGVVQDPNQLQNQENPNEQNHQVPQNQQTRGQRQAPAQVQQQQQQQGQNPEEGVQEGDQQPQESGQQGQPQNYDGQNQPPAIFPSEQQGQPQQQQQPQLPDIPRELNTR